jgi:signal transduction histidine kinase
LHRVRRKKIRAVRKYFFIFSLHFSKALLYYMDKTKWAVIFFVLLAPSAWCQHMGMPEIKNYSPDDYNAAPQNWQICQDLKGLLFVANSSGLLEFDGVAWRKIEVPNIVARSVGVGIDGKVYVGAVGDFGYLDYTKDGETRFISMLHLIPNQYRDFVDVWRTSATTEGIYFKTNKYVFFWDGKQIVTWKAPIFFAFSFVVNDDFYVKEDSLGLVYFRNKKMHSLPVSLFFKDKDIRSILPINQETVLISTLAHGMFRYTYATEKLEPFATEADNFIRQNLLFSSSLVNDSTLAFGTFRGGLLLMKTSGKIIKIINEESGLRENSVRALYLDRENSLWLGLNDGIGHIEVNSPLTFFDRRMKIKGSVYQVNRHEKTLFIGTSVGLNYLTPDGQIRSIENFADQVWSLYSVDDQQLLGTNNDTHVIKNFSRSWINNSGGSFVFCQSQKDPNRVFVGLRDGLQSLYRDKKGWHVETTYAEIKGQVKSLLEDRRGGLWLVSQSLGVVRIDFDDTYKPSYSFLSVGEDKPTLGNSSLVLLNGEVHVFSNFKFMKHNAENGQLEPSKILIGNQPSVNQAFTLAQDTRGDLLIWSNSQIGYLTKNSDSSFHWNDSLFYRVRDKAINFVYADGDSLVWVGSSNGLYRLDKRISKSNRLSYETLVRRVSMIDNDSVLFQGVSNGDIQEFTFAMNKLRFHFAAPFFEHSDETSYQTFLEGSDREWSLWSTHTTKDYTNLWEGHYTFHVRAKNIYGLIGREATYAFSIAPPWHRTTKAYVAYVIVFFGLLLVSAKIYFKRLRDSNKLLELLVENRTQEIKIQKEEIEAQRDHILDKNILLEAQNEQIEKQNESIEDKNKDLLQAQQIIEKQNSDLLQMNHQLEEIVEKRTRELTLSNADLTAANKELDTFFYRAAHDLKGPIATLLGLCQLSLLQIKDREALEYLSKMKLTAERMSLLLFLLTKVNRIKTEDVVVSEVNVEKLLNELCDFFIPDYKNQTHVKISITVQDNIQLFTDGKLLRTVIENLLDNAIKFAKPGIASIIHISVSRAMGRVHISVMDNGVGIDKEHRSKVFDMFFIGNTEQKGTGLGLYTVKMAVKKLNGTVSLVDHSGDTCFLVDIPERLNER